MIQTSYTNMRTNLARYLDRVVNDCETVVIHRRGYEDVVMISAEELNGLLETAHLLRSPKNAVRLQTALDRACTHSEPPQSTATFKAELGLTDESA